MNKQKKFLCVHQSAELYGSDRVFAESVKAIRKEFPEAQISVLLPFRGPLENVLRDHVSEIKYFPLIIIRRSDFKSIANCIRFCRNLCKFSPAIRLINEYDCVYISTIVLADFVVASWLSKPFRKTTVITHIHELVDSKIGKLWGKIILWGADRLICNSFESAKSFGVDGNKKTSIIWNGTELHQPSILEQAAHQVTSEFEARILMPGRINSWKGQRLLIEACQLMKLPGRKILIRIVGDTAPSQEFYRQQLEELTKQLGIQSRVSFFGFLPDISEHYLWADIVVIPSIKPEPFGLVAIEAMGFAKPVIAANHGGLCEIVQHNVTGWLFPPNDKVALAELLSEAFTNSEKLLPFGTAARKRAEDYFSLKQYNTNFLSIVKNC